MIILRNYVQNRNINDIIICSVISVRGNERFHSKLLRLSCNNFHHDACVIKIVSVDARASQRRRLKRP